MSSTSTSSSSTKAAAAATALFIAAIAAFFGYQHFYPKRHSDNETSASSHDAAAPLNVIQLSEQACSNLGLRTVQVSVGSYWKKIQTTGIISDRPGFTDRNLTSPVDCVVATVHAMEGDIVKPGERLFTLRIVSEYLQNAQSRFFRATREIEILNKEIKRIKKLAASGVIPEKRIIELKQNIARQQAQIDASRQELVARGFNLKQLSQIQSGKFIASIDIVVPQQKQLPPSQNESLPIKDTQFDNPTNTREPFLEIQELNAQLGQQVKAGELLAVLANHSHLYIKGHAFKNEAANIARATENNWNIAIEFLDDASQDWPPLLQPLQIRHLSNTIDPINRTFDFFIPLANQSRTYVKDDEKFIVWRFRPGQRVRLHVPADAMNDVIVVPSSAVFNSGPDSFVFQQNGDLYNRIDIKVLHRDRLNTVIENNGNLLPGFTIAENCAASLNRILKVQNASGENAGNFHVHADGTVHANH